MEIAKKLKLFLEQSDIRVVMTRESDAAKAPRKRICAVSPIRLVIKSPIATIASTDTISKLIFLFLIRCIFFSGLLFAATGESTNTIKQVIMLIAIKVRLLNERYILASAQHKKTRVEIM